ncbi:MAG TPA: AraC family transcriptional regulator [Phenylobacterium sp.]|jgi:AraC-like DNA-binding protein|uniref:AraC family transcriptional regulator n=1 Tax=Phenylobacterium sp. TaxID=1871053 RepID=UPI002D4E02E7|nr:AraC family transcriptional regulator [Phenylobacterium sp.]HZZ68218.1 AraC family transcriptional regulator [Phenylobacterium sp.]
MSHLARSAGLTGFVDLSLALGVDPYKIAGEVGIPVAAFNDPDMKVPARALSQMHELAAERSGAEDFGLRLAEVRRFSNLGPVALVIREQPTVRAALEQLRRYIWLQNDAYSTDMQETGDIAVVRLSSPAWTGRQGSEVALGAAMRIFRELLGESWRPLEVYFPHGAPARLDMHLKVFGVAPRFSQDFLGIVIARADLDRPISSADPDMARQVVRYLEQIAAGRGANFSDKVREMVVLLLPEGGVTVERVAGRLAMDRRTLHRRLAAEGTTFSALLNAARREAAEPLLSRSERSFQSVAELLGFSSLSAFAHWFRRQFGLTASAYRARYARDEAAFARDRMRAPAA